MTIYRSVYLEVCGCRRTSFVKYSNSQLVRDRYTHMLYPPTSLPPLRPAACPEPRDAELPLFAKREGAFMVGAYEGVGVA